MENLALEFDWVQALNVTQNSTVLFRADSSAGIGSGHIMRCLTLAEELRENSKAIRFICRELPGNMIENIETHGFEVLRLPLGLETDSWQVDAEQTREILLRNRLKPDWLVVDNYDLDKGWESALRPFVGRIMVIDDQANREHDCDLILDQNYYQNMGRRYQGLVPQGARQLLGPKYALLRREFRIARQQLPNRDGSVRRILVFYGGSDPTNETAKALEAIGLLNRPDITVDVVVGAANSNRGLIKEVCFDMVNTKFYCQVNNMAELMVRADLALGAGGTATWERCYVGLPALITVVAANQRETVEALAEAGVVSNIGWHEEVSVDELVESLKALLNSLDQLREMALRGIALFEG